MNNKNKLNNEHRAMKSNGEYSAGFHFYDGVFLIEKLLFENGVAVNEISRGFQEYQYF